MTRGNSILAALLAVSLGWAYTLAHPPLEEPGRGDTEPLIWSVPLEEVTRITFVGKKAKFVLEPKPSQAGAGLAVWVRHEPGPAAGKRGSAARRPGVQVFRGNRQADDLLRNLAAPRATRRIGRLDRLNAEEFGFPGDSGYVLLARLKGETPLRLNLGGYSVGKRLRYVHNGADDLVYLVRQTLIAPFERAARGLMARELLPFPLVEADRMVLRGAGREKTLWRVATAPGKRVRWSESQQDTKGDPTLLNFINAMARIRVLEYILAEAAKPAVQPQLELRVYKSGQPDAWVRLFPGEGAAMTAISSFTERAVRVPSHQAKAAHKIASQILQN